MSVGRRIQPVTHAHQRYREGGVWDETEWNKDWLSTRGRAGDSCTKVEVLHVLDTMPVSKSSIKATAHPPADSQSLEKGVQFMKTYGNARFIDCPGVVSDGVGGHAMRDNCWSCAPFWARIPMCPLDTHVDRWHDEFGNWSGWSRKLTDNGYCKGCRKHFLLVDAQVTDGDEQAVATQVLR